MGAGAGYQGTCWTSGGNEYFCSMKRIEKILVTGASGFVGSRIVNALQKRFRLITPSHTEFDITSEEDVERFIQSTKPDAVIHAAAISNTGYCQEHPEESYLVNVTGVENIARSAARHGIKLVFFSSDQVYTGNCECGLLSEDMPVAPENHYGRHKLLAEERAIAICPDSVALRATWMYDDLRSGMKTHDNFVLNFRKAKENGTRLRFATREFRGITWIDDVVRNIPYTMDLPGGVYNFGAENLLNSYETAVEYAKASGWKAEEIVIPDTERFPEHIRNLSISMKKALEASDGKIRFRDTLEGLKAFNMQSADR